MPADPWVYQYLLPLEDMETGEVLIFVTPSFGGRRAVADLCSEYAKHTKKTGGGQPIIELAKTDFPSKKFGKVLRPLFEIVGWDEARDIEVMSPASSSTPESKDAGDEMDDEIPSEGSED